MGKFDSLIFDESAFDEGAAWYNLGAILAATRQPTYQQDAIIARGQNIEINYATSLKGDRVRYSMGVLLAYDPDVLALRESIINTVFYSFAQQLEDVYVRLTTSGIRHKLEYAAGSDLDEHWGKVLDLRRWDGESDASYRIRLLIYISTLTSSGSKSNCETVLDKIVGQPGSATIETYWPALARVRWSSVEVMKIAQSKLDIIEDTLDAMIASGVTWNMSFPYADYHMDYLLSGPVKIDYLYRAIVERSGKTYPYLHAATLMLTNVVTQDYDSLLEKRLSKSYLMDPGHMGATRTRSSEADTVLEALKKVLYQMVTLAVKRCQITYGRDGLVEKDMARIYAVDVLSERTFSKQYMMATRLVA